MKSDIFKKKKTLIVLQTEKAGDRKNCGQRNAK